MEYRIVNTPMSDDAPEAVIGCYRWEDNGYTPVASARLTRQGDTLHLRLKAEETAPTVRYRRGTPNPRVWCDSCLEFFCSANDSERYLNLEMNADGCYICRIGADRHERVPCDPFAKGGEPVGTVTETGWQVDAVLSLRKLAACLGVETVTTLRGNFYKCGDETPLPHFGMWAPVDLPAPDFHCPAYFRPLTLSDGN